LDWTTHKILIGYPPKGSSYPARNKATQDFYDAFRSCFSAFDDVHAAHQVPSIWVRDFMPVPTNGRYLAFQPCLAYMDPHERQRYTGFSTLPLLRTLVPDAMCKQVPLILDGGNVVMNSRYVICSDKIFEDNKNRSAGEIERLLARVFERQPAAPMLHTHNVSVLEKLQCELVSLPYYPKGRMMRGWYPAEGCVNFAQTKNVTVVPTYGTDDLEFSKLISLHDVLVRPLQRSSCGPISGYGGGFRCVTWNY
jgi:hypothetical protein